MSELEENDETNKTLTGAALLRERVKSLPNAPGVYRMFDADDSLLYVGKAKSLKKRVVSYTRGEGLTARILRMVSLTRRLEVITTSSEIEALLLESNLIKRLRPQFNILLRDDKSFPYITFDHNHPYPRIGKHRGSRRKGVSYFGPFASAGAVNETINTLLRAFPIRNCRNSEFEARTRPCLQFQIKRCSAPCVDRIDKEAYAQLVAEASDFLNGRSQHVQKQLADQMQEAAEALDFERAAALRDRIKAMAHITSKQDINLSGLGDIDLMALARRGDMACVQVFFYRGGQNFGNRAYFPTQIKDASDAQVMSAFIAQFYEERLPAGLLLTNIMPDNGVLIADALATKIDKRVDISVPQRGQRRQIMSQALENAERELALKSASQSSHAKWLAQLTEMCEAEQPIKRIEIYDNSHIQGKHALGAFVVFNTDGLDKSQYRKFTIKDTELSPGDDFGMMREVLMRRLKRLKANDPAMPRPDLLIIDGGLGQLNAVREVLMEMDSADIPVLAVAKGPERDAGKEVLHLPGKPPFSLPMRDPLLYFIQRMRDEAHRFVISGHRAKRSKAIVTSKLDDIPGIGPGRKKALLNQFGSASGVESASLRDLESVNGVSKSIARTIYDYFHEK